MRSQSSSIAISNTAQYDDSNSVVVENLPERVAVVKTLDKRNWDGSLPFPIDTFWP